MPKRQRSGEFGGSPLQLKTHIGQKQMNESKEENMKDVYARTRALLFGASSKPPPPTNGTSTCNGFSNGVVNVTCNGQSNGAATNGTVLPSNGTVLPSGQATLDLYGHLIPAHSTQGKDMNGSTPSNLCTQCRRAMVVKPCPCNYCDKPICHHCQKRCDNCSGSFCLFCTTVNYDDRYEKRLCINCSS